MDPVLEAVVRNLQTRDAGGKASGFLDDDPARILRFSPRPFVTIPAGAVLLQEDVTLLRCWVGGTGLVSAHNTERAKRFAHVHDITGPPAQAQHSGFQSTDTVNAWDYYHGADPYNNGGDAAVIPILTGNAAFGNQYHLGLGFAGNFPEEDAGRLQTMLGQEVQAQLAAEGWTPEDLPPECFAGGMGIGHGSWCVLLDAEYVVNALHESYWSEIGKPVGGAEKTHNQEDKESSLVQPLEQEDGKAASSSAIASPLKRPRSIRSPDEPLPSTSVAPAGATSLLPLAATTRRSPPSLQEIERIWAAAVQNVYECFLSSTAFKPPAVGTPSSSAAAAPSASEKEQPNPKTKPSLFPPVLDTARSSAPSTATAGTAALKVFFLTNFTLLKTEDDVVDHVGRSRSYGIAGGVFPTTAVVFRSYQVVPQYNRADEDQSAGVVLADEVAGVNLDTRQTAAPSEALFGAAPAEIGEAGGTATAGGGDLDVLSQESGEKEEDTSSTRPMRLTRGDAALRAAFLRGMLSQASHDTRSVGGRGTKQEQHLAKITKK